MKWYSVLVTTSEVSFRSEVGATSEAQAILRAGVEVAIEIDRDWRYGRIDQAEYEKRMTSLDGEALEISVQCITEESNHAERQQVWDQRIRQHARTCKTCRDTEDECAEWLDVIKAYNEGRQL